MSIHVNGWTDPSAAELKQLMALHGGRFENYYSRQSVTHIVATNLPDTKVKMNELTRAVACAPLLLYFLLGCPVLPSIKPSGCATDSWLRAC